jgi:hypothetical protein
MWRTIMMRGSVLKEGYCPKEGYFVGRSSSPHASDSDAQHNRGKGAAQERESLAEELGGFSPGTDLNRMSLQCWVKPAHQRSPSPTESLRYSD